VTDGSQGRSDDNNFGLIRLFAACQVLLIHSQVHLHLKIAVPIIPFVDSFPGVPIFFVVSGFLVTQSYVTGSGGVVGYALRRGLRIYPGLWVHYLVVFAALAITGAFAFSTLFTAVFWRWVAASFLLGSDFWGNIYANAYPFSTDGLYKLFPSGVLWTIAVELGFYLLVPLVFADFIRSRRRVWLSMLVAAAASLCFAQILREEVLLHPGFNTTGELKSSPLAYFWVFLIGGAIWIYWERIKGLFVGKALLWLAIYFVLTQFDRHYFHKQTIDLDNMIGLTLPRMLALAGLVISFAHTAPWLSRWLKADLSYGMYLYHMPLIWTLVGLGLSESRWLWFVAFGGAAVIAALSWFLVEKPAQKFKRYSKQLAAFVGQYSKTLKPEPRTENVAPESRSLVQVVDTKPEWQGARLVSSNETRSLTFGHQGKGPRDYTIEDCPGGRSHEARQRRVGHGLGRRTSTGGLASYGPTAINRFRD
jgi:peptidoglycan/LPS O-acetylase OafA/YrhL